MAQALQIAVVGDDTGARREAAATLQRAGFPGAFEAHDASECVPANLVVACGRRADEAIQSVRGNYLLDNHPLLAMCPVDQDGSRCLEAGADELLWPDEAPERLRTRVERVCRQASERHGAREILRYQQTILDIRNLMAQRGDGADVLREILLRAAAHLGFERGSLIAHVETSAAAYVLAATDDPGLTQFELAIHDYPEIREAMTTGEPLLVEDVNTHAVIAPVRELLLSRGVEAIAVFPVTWKGRSMGALLFRNSTPGVDHISNNGRDFGMMLAAQLGAQLRDSSLFERLRDQTRRLSRAGFEAERRARTIESFREYFEASSDGIFVLDQEGRVLFSNGAACNLTGFALDALIGIELASLMEVNEAQAISDIIDEVLDGNNIEAVDVDLKTTSGRFITVSMTTSTVLSKHGAVIISFRDVTHQRSLEAQLQQSRDFLENLIDSAVDAIVAADLRGRIIVFNQGAEKLFGYNTEDIIGRAVVPRLYPEGVPEQVMKMLRSESYGGVGRLEQIRREVVTSSGELVPVNMTASIIYDGGRELATVGIFSDLRDRIRIEQRLLQAQEELKQREQQSMIAELAGAAAHELNQPLTSIIGYAQLIQKTAELSDRHTRYTDTIVQEAERMSEIVRKIGRITHYETVNYVGSANIVDLNKSVEASESAPVPAFLSDYEDESTARITIDEIAASHESEMAAEADKMELAREGQAEAKSE